ncbi:crossover junction endodeoxyribonuclease RuvC [soil metagenome]
MQLSPPDSRKNKDKIILGIDPGTTVMGFGIISIHNNKMKLIEMDVLRLEKIKDPAGKLKMIFEKTQELVDKYLPDEFAIEAPFFGKNVQSMLKLGRAQGVAIAASLSRGIPIFEYSPKKIKMSITGNGNSSKEQVAAMLQQLLAIKNLPKFLDATDGLAAAVCHHFQNTNSGIPGKKYGSWNSFLTDNPERLKKK